MKTIFITFLCAFYSICNAQQEKIFQPELNFFINVEKGIGNNQLSEAHSIGKGLGLEFNFLNNNHFKFGIGFQYNSFSVNNQSFIGNYTSTRFQDFYLLFSYDFILSKKFCLEPTIQIGKSVLKQIADNQIYNTNTINSNANINFGLAINYNLTKKTILYLRPMYVNRNFDIKVNPDYEDFFNNNESIAVNIGVKFLFHRF